MEAHRGNLSGSTSHELLKQINGQKSSRLSISLWHSWGRLLRSFVDLTTPLKKLLMTFGDDFVTGLALWTNANRPCVTSKVEDNLTASHWQNSSKSCGLCIERPGQIRLTNSAIQSSSDASKMESPLLNSDSIYVFTTETLRNFRQTTEKARLFAATMGETKSKKSVRFVGESTAPAIHHMAVPTIDFTPVLCRLDDIEKFSGKWIQEPDKAVSAYISSPPRQDTTSPTAGRSQNYNSGRGSMPSRGRTSWPGRGGQSVRGRGTFQSREQTQPATPPPSPRLASQNNRLPVRGQTFFCGRGRGRGSVCWICQREGCFSWNHPPLENREPPTPPPQDERTPSRRTTSPRPGCYVCGSPLVAILISTVEMHEMSYVPPPFQPNRISPPITEPENGFRSRRPGERAPPVPPHPSCH